MGDLSRLGGTERVTTVIASELARRKCDVSILSLVNGRTSYFPLHPGVRLLSLQMENRSANLSDFLIWWRLHRFVKRESIDYVIDVDVILSWYSIPACIGTSAKVVSWEHFHFFINLGDPFQRFRRVVARKLAARYAKNIVTLTEKDRLQYLANLSCKTGVLAINNPNTIAHGQRARLDAKVVLAAGRLAHQKGFDLLLESWAMIAQRVPDWSLRIVGSGSDESMLKELARHLKIDQSVEFVPKTDNLISHYLSASIYALSSRFEGFALVLSEAKSFGLPSVSFDCDCGPSDIVHDGKDGLLVKNGDIEGFAQALLILINDGPMRMKFGDMGYQDHRFNLGRIVDVWEFILA